MKKLALACALFLLSVSCMAQTVSCNAASSAGDCTTLTLSSASTTLSYHVSVDTGVPTAVSVSLQGSNDGGSTWITIDTAVISDYSNSLPGSYSKVRCIVNTFIRGTSNNLSCSILPNVGTPLIIRRLLGIGVH